MFTRSIRNPFLSLASFGALTLNLHGASAETPSTDAVLQKLAALEARVATLENKNREYKREAAEARAQAREANERFSRISGTSTVTRNVTSAMAYKAGPTDRAAPAGWTGAYWGASAGGAATRSGVASTERVSQSFPTNQPPFDLIGYSGLANSGGKGTGGIVDLYAGWNTQISRFVLGAQIEATGADVNFSSTGLKAYTYFDSTGPTGQTAVGDFRPQVASRWMASALLRAGVLVDDQTLVYAVGGWTGARFEARNVTDNQFYQPVESFWANGWSVGGGIEHKLDSSWSVRAEYRYTEFGTVQTNDHFRFATSLPSAQTYDRQTQYNQSMQAGRIGFAYTLNPLK